jgi:predicted cobalt transporter CbtA
LDKLKGVTAVLTDVEITEMKANSSQIMSSVRWGLHGFTLVWLCVLLAFGNGLLPEPVGASQWGRPTLWLAAMYALMFSSETWLRMRGRMPER